MWHLNAISLKLVENVSLKKKLIFWIIIKKKTYYGKTWTVDEFITSSNVEMNLVFP